MEAQDMQGMGTIGLATYVIVEIVKRAGMPTKFAPLFSLGIGLVLGAASFAATGKPWYGGLLEGFWGAAAASGVYSGTKAAFTPKTVHYDDDPALRPQC